MHPSRQSKVSLVFFFLFTVAAVAPAQTFTTLVTFVPSNTGRSDGMPTAPFVQGIDGNLYVGTNIGIDRMTPEGALSPLNHGGEPSGMTLALNGNLYGAVGGSCGAVFGLTSAGTRFTLHSFSSADGCTPWGGVTLGPDGNFYGITGGDGTGASALGNVFKVTYNGIFTVLHSFNGTDGTEPRSPLVLGNNGNFYGTTYQGGSSGNGTVFMITPSGTLTSLHSFDGITDGGNPLGAMVQGADGNLYGTTLSTVFMISPGGHTFKTLHNFTNTNNAPNGPLVLGSDGNLYGTTFAGRPNDPSVIFEITPQGVFTVLHSFATPHGSVGLPTLMQHTNGTFYGTTFGDGLGAGTLFSLSTGLGQFIETVPPMRGIGSRVLILGQGFTGATSVTFNGVTASFTVNSDTEITAIVPAGATKGLVQVTTPSGTLSTKVVFVVD